jgi:hypothetical protein
MLSPWWGRVFDIPTIFFYLGSDANKNKREDNLNKKNMTKD